MQESLTKESGIDSALQKQMKAEVVKWREIFRCILNVTLFLAKQHLSFRGISRKIGEHDNSLFLDTLELLSQHNRVLEQHLQEVKQHQDRQERTQTHYLSWSSQNDFILKCEN